MIMGMDEEQLLKLGRNFTKNCSKIYKNIENLMSKEMEYFKKTFSMNINKILLMKMVYK